MLSANNQQHGHYFLGARRRTNSNLFRIRQVLPDTPFQPKMHSVSCVVCDMMVVNLHAQDRLYKVGAGAY